MAARADGPAVITVAQMVYRARLLARNRTRHRPRAVAPAPPPRAALTEYTRALVALSRDMDDAIFEVLRADRIVRADNDAPLPPMPSQIERAARDISAHLDRLASRASLVGAIDRIAGKVTASSRDAWRAELRAAFGIDQVHDPVLAPLVARFRTENLALIRSLARDKVDRVRAVLEDARGRRVEDLAAQVRDTTGATEARAALIARDQVLKLNGQVARARHEAAGIVEYTWNTSHDERVRPGHAALDGTRQGYARPPVVDPKSGRRCNPGEDFQCRCVAVPVLPGID